MSDDHAAILERRIDRMEESIIDKLDSLTNRVNQLGLDAARHQCPDPGACVLIRAEMIAAQKRISEHASRIDSLNRWQAWITGVGATSIFLIGLFGPSIRTILKLP
jgi:hypothetical protein